MRTAHAGNIANNAYLVAKFLRRRGEDAHAYHFRSEFIMGHPEWEDADFDAELDPFDPPDWGTLRFTNGYVRPEWVHYLSGLPHPFELPMGTSGGAATRVMAATYGASPPASGGLARVLRAGSAAVATRYAQLARRGQLRPGERLQLQALALVRLAVEWLAAERAERRWLLSDRLRAVVAEADAINHDSRLAAAGRTTGMHDLAKTPFWASYRPMAAGHDLVQLYGLEAAKGVFLPPETPFVAFEHSTMRSLPFEATVQGRLLALAYRTADYCVITNPDVVGSARRLGLERYRFIPHPLDETKYAPLPGGSPNPLRAELQRQTGAELLFLCPTRHEWSDTFDSKRSDRVIRAFAAYGRGDHPRAALILSRWGRDVRASEQLIEAEGIAGRVVWRHPMHKLRLLDHYRAADVVLDQFHESVGTFGTVTAEALSCARPVVMYFNPAVHEWCLPELPPIESALTEQEIEQKLVALAHDPERRARVGAASRAWILKWHGWERCADDHLATYAEVLARRGQPRLERATVP